MEYIAFAILIGFIVIVYAYVIYSNNYWKGWDEGFNYSEQFSYKEDRYNNILKFRRSKMNNVFISFADWCERNPIKKILEKPNCEKEDGPFLFRIDAETHARILEDISKTKFEVVEFEDIYYVIRNKNR